MLPTHVPGLTRHQDEPPERTSRVLRQALSELAKNQRSGGVRADLPV